jgi:hypothetical protein
LVDFGGKVFAVAEDDEVLGGFPEPEEARMLGMVFAVVEECFFGGEEFGGSGVAGVIDGAGWGLDV